MAIVGFDNTLLSLLLNPNAGAPLNPSTGQAVSGAKLRAEHLVQVLGKSRAKIIIPAPAAAEILTVIGPDAQQYISLTNRSRVFQVGRHNGQRQRRLVSVRQLQAVIAFSKTNYSIRCRISFCTSDVPS